MKLLVCISNNFLENNRIVMIFFVQIFGKSPKHLNFFEEIQITMKNFNYGVISIQNIDF